MKLSLLSAWQLCAALFFLILLCPSGIQAQSNYKAGYVVSIDGDTLHGYIDYKEWAQNPASFSFRKSARDGSEQVLNVSNTLYFEITGMEAYQRYEGPVSMHATDLKHLTNNSTAEPETVIVFLKIHQKGVNVNLLSYTDKIKTRYFIQENDNSIPEELYYRRYYASGAKSNQMFTQKSYIGQLGRLAAKYEIESPKLKREIEAANYKIHNFSKIVNLLNENSGPALKASEKENSNIRFYTGFALSSNTATILGNHHMSNASNNSAHIAPRITFGSDIFVNRHVQKMLLRLEASAAVASYTIENSRRFSMGTSNFNYEIAQQTVSFGPQLIYNFYNSDNFKVYAGASAQLNYSRYTRNTYYSQTLYDGSASEPRRNVNENYMDLAPVWFSMAVRTGIIVNRKYEITAAYSPPATVTYYNHYSLNFTSLSLGMNYHFKR